jgi:hypothetical protein
MTRRPPTIHAVPIGARGDHRIHACPCRPIEAVDLADGPLGRLILVQRDIDSQEEAIVPRRVVGRPW